MSIWNPTNIEVLGKVQSGEITKEQATQIIGCTRGALNRKLGRYRGGHEPVQSERNWKKWSVAEMITLWTMRTSKPPKSFEEIANALSRSVVSIERCWQETNWTDFVVRHAVSDGPNAKLAAPVFEKRLALYVLDLVRGNPERLGELDKRTVLDKVKHIGVSDFNFTNIMQLAREELAAVGSLRPEGHRFGPGTYIVVGDSHGKHTRRGIFALLQVLQNHLNAKGIIHIGHMLDDDNDVSYCWKDLQNVTVVAKNIELRLLIEAGHNGKLTPKQTENIQRNYIYLGNLMVGNQEIIQDYTLSPLGSLPRLFFEKSAILNLHRHELDTRTTCGEETQLFSPGCLCKGHIIKTIKQINFKDQTSVKVAYHDGFIKYQKMQHQINGWENGLCIVHVAKDGSFDVIQSRIHRTSKGYSCSYFDKIITEAGVEDPQEKIFFSADVHCDLHDAEVLDLQEQFCNLYKPARSIDIGDLMNNKGFNHHIVEQSGFAIPHSVINELAQTRWLLERRAKWAPKNTLMFGNHERFLKDMAQRMPQFAEMFTPSFLLDLESIGISIVDFKRTLRHGQMNFVHGDVRMIGSRGGNKIDKIFNTYGANTISAHSHYPATRLGCYLVGLTGQMDQEYNEVETSRWMHGFGYVNVFDGIPFIGLVHIRGKKFRIGDHSFTPKNPSNWDAPQFKASIAFEFKK